eukprot:3599836-Amphidinium_carterae.1
MSDTEKDQGIVIVKRLGSKMNACCACVSLSVLASAAGLGCSLLSLIIPIVSRVVLGTPRSAPTVVAV